MRWIRRLAWLASIVVLALGLGLAGAAAWSLDWGRAHRARSEALARVPPATGAEGLVGITTPHGVFRARIGGFDRPGTGVILLHGFPETSAMWAPLLEAAVAAGYRVVAFDQRGYSPGARPEGVAPYAIPELVGDVVAVADAVGFDRFHLVGHDWGAIAGWVAASEHPERVISWTAMSIPHPGTLIEEIAADGPPTYIRALQIPWLPELLLSALMPWLYAEAPDELREEYLGVFSEPGAWTAAINWYRAIPIGVEAAGGNPGRVSQPVLFLWGNRDFWAARFDPVEQRARVEGAYQEIEFDAGHVLMAEETDRVVEAVLAHLGRTDDDARRPGQ